MWFDAPDLPCSCGGDHQAAILLCSTCGYLVCTGGMHDAAHHQTDLIRSPH